ncbi:hypothetical protein IQ63_00925 [Streptomyces acidiscabies]|uniref:Uncharacterized protein n=1 Tax=Streptomyces acidiscabies TaxID=42234 RepID=A0A0L0KQX2_9ACTN|nr:hypothetical protein IQ63_00925 [Streptomyces acidiscabies]
MAPPGFRGRGDDGDGGLGSRGEVHVDGEVQGSGQAHDDSDGRQFCGGLDAFDVVGGGVRALGQVGLAQSELLAPVVDGFAQCHGQAGFVVDAVVLGVGVEVLADQPAVAASPPFAVIHRFLPSVASEEWPSGSPGRPGR